jgi:hypothetical protein
MGPVYAVEVPDGEHGMGQRFEGFDAVNDFQSDAHLILFPVPAGFPEGAPSSIALRPAPCNVG